MQNNDIAGRARLAYSGALREASTALRNYVTFPQVIAQTAGLFRARLRSGKVLAFVVASCISGFGAAHAQDSAIGFQAKRIDLQNRLTSRETELLNPKLSGTKRKEAQAEVAVIKSRLEQGDFKTGDLLVVTVNVEDKPSVDTATVRDNGMITISRVPDVSVAKVLRSEVQETVRKHVAVYFKQPDVRVNFTTRITMKGAVGHTGSLNVSPDRPISELMTLAGGPAPNAKTDQLEVKRGNRTILSINDSKKALMEGKTVEQVGIQNGDEVVIPKKRSFSWQGITQTVFLISSLTFALINFLRYYYSEE